MSDNLLPYAPIILKLLQGVVYYDDKHWEQLISYASPLTRHFATIGLQLHLDESEGYAYLTQPDTDDDAPDLPRLVRRIPLTYDATLLCVLLRESLQQFEAHSPDQARHVLSRNQIKELIQLFLPEKSDMTKLDRRVDSAIRQVENISFLKKLNSSDEDAYEVRRIIKAKISADALASIRDQLQQHLDEDED
ncbi:MAG TPA: DUF4194 domain-containing protein [Anaerolineae bacterium]|nr:DUF4194 domain-containing protein [Anaerolineae bacterium]